MNNENINKENIMKLNGPGIWYIIHRSALLKDNIVDTVIKYLPCQECTNHCKNWIKNNPPPKDDNDMFLWTIKMHNHVNEKLGKPNFLYTEALELYKIKPCRLV